MIQCINMQVSSFIAVYKLFKSWPIGSILGAPGGVQNLTEGIYVYRLESSNITSWCIVEHKDWPQNMSLWPTFCICRFAFRIV